MALPGNKDGYELPEDYKEKLKSWMKEFKDDWDYKKKLVKFGDSQGNIYTPTTTTTTTTKPTSPSTPRPVTSAKPDGSTFVPTPVANVTLGPYTGGVSLGDTTDVVKIALITVGSLVGVIVLIAVVVRLCKGSSKKEDSRISLRRTLQPEVEDHIYAEIEPLQAQRSESPSGSSSGAVVLPVRKDHRKKSHVRALSTRLYRFFNLDHSDTEDHSSVATVSYNRNNQNSSVISEVPELPGRNVANGRNKRRGRGVQRGESTASQRPLLGGDSLRSSDGAEMRDNIYNPLMRNSENRESGPYEHLTGKLRESEDRSSAASIPEEPPHDYFTLAAEGKTDNVTDVGSKQDDKRVIDTIQESDEEVDSPVKGHDYFILKPHKREDIESEDKPSNGNCSPSRKSASPTKSNPASPSKDKEKPVATPRVTKSGSANSEENDSGKEVEELVTAAEAGVIDVKHESNVTENGETTNNKAEDEVDDMYVLGKLGEAPEPPQVVVDEDYMTPSELGSKPEYIDVFPTPPPRSTSLHAADTEGQSVKQETAEKEKMNAIQEETKVISPKRETVKLKTSTETDV